MDAGQHTEGHGRIAPKGFAQTGCVDSLQGARHAGLKQGSDGVVMVNTGHCFFNVVSPGAHESKAVTALDAAKGRDVKHLVSTQFLAVMRRIEQVAVTLAKGVVDLDHDGPQAAVRSVAIPEAHWLESETQHARVSVQPDFALRIGNALGQQERVEPGQAIAAAVTVVAVMKGQEPTAVACQRRTAVCLHGAQWQH